MWQQLAGLKIKSAYQRAYLERPRGHSKTTDLALMVAWIMQYGQFPLSGIVAAADVDQGRLLKSAVERIASQNLDLCPDLKFRQQGITNSQTQSQLNVISSDVNSSWGLLPDYIICDELCHWEKPDLWYSLLSSAAKKPSCILVVLSNAGVGRGWQWETREAARTSSTWYFSTLQGTQANWISSALLDEQKKLLPKTVYARLWENIWQDSDGEFVTLAAAEACQNSHLSYQHQGEHQFTYYAAIDYGPLRDYTVAVVAHRELGITIIDRMDVVVPDVNHPTPVSWVREWILEMATLFPGVSFTVDEYQLLSLIQEFEHQLPIQKFSFSGRLGNHKLAVGLQQAIRERKIAWYPGCGQITTTNGRDDIETELSEVLLEHFPNGMVRINHRQDGKHHDDRVFALGVVHLAVMTSEAAPDFLQIEDPDRDGSFHW